MPTKRCFLYVFSLSLFPPPIPPPLPSSGEKKVSHISLSKKKNPPPKKATELADEIDFLLIFIKKTAARIKRNRKTQQIKFKVRCHRFLYTLVLKDSDKADKLKQSLPPSTISFFFSPSPPPPFFFSSSFFSFLFLERKGYSPRFFFPHYKY